MFIDIRASECVHAFKEKHYEIRVLFADNTITVAAFYQNHPANGFRHQIKILKRFEPEKLLEKDVVKEMVEISKSDIIENRWEKVMKVFEMK